MKVKEALVELRKEKKRKFSQSIDLIINLKGLDLRRDSINIIATVPYKIRDKKICGFFDKRSSIVDSVTKIDFPKYKDKKNLKDLVKKYDFFISSASLMPSVAATFGKVLGPTGKMPSPQLGILSQENEEAVREVLQKINKSLKIRAKEASLKMSIANEDMEDKHIEENVLAVYNAVVNSLPSKQDNIKNIMLKFSMTKPLKLEMR